MYEHAQAISCHQLQGCTAQYRCCRGRLVAHIQHPPVTGCAMGTITTSCPHTASVQRAVPSTRARGNATSQPAKKSKTQTARTSADSLRSPPIDDKKDCCCCSGCCIFGDPPRLLSPPPELLDEEERSRSLRRWWLPLLWRASFLKVGVEAIDGDPPLGDVTSCSKMLPPGSLASSAPEGTLTAAAPTRALASERPRIDSWRRRSDLWISAIYGCKQQHGCAALCELRLLAACRRNLVRINAAS